MNHLPLAILLHILYDFLIARNNSFDQRRTKSLVFHFIEAGNGAAFGCCYFIYFLFRVRIFANNNSAAPFTVCAAIKEATDALKPISIPPWIFARI